MGWGPLEFCPGVVGELQGFQDDEEVGRGAGQTALSLYLAVGVLLVRKGIGICCPLEGHHHYCQPHAPLHLDGDWGVEKAGHDLWVQGCHRP